MKKILKYFALISLCTAALVACKQEAFDTDQYGTGVKFSALAPNPVMRGGELRILGSNLDQVAAVNFAGNVSVTDINVVQAGPKGEIRVIVPLEGPEVGKVTLVAKDGSTSSSHFDLAFSEPISIDSFTPEEVLSNDVITFKGEYLNDVKEVIFSGTDAVATEFVSQSRHELKVTVPGNAITGPVILSDVNEIEDQNTIPNHIYTATDLVVGKPTVVKAEKAIYKSGDVIKVEGEHLDMIMSVDLPQAADVHFLRGRDADWITFNLPPEATDGNIVLTSFAGDTFDAGEIETVTVKDLAIKSLAEDERYKAGTEVEITGKDLDLVTKVEFTNSDEGSWYYSDGKILAIQPADAKDGSVTLTLDSGKKAYTEAIEVVKPEISDCEFFDEYVAGKTVVTVLGEDLDLVTDVTIGDKDHGFIPCEYELTTDELGYTDVKVKIPEQAYTGPITFYSAAGYTTSTVTLEITYDMAVSITFDAQSFAMGKPVSFTGKNLMKIEQVFVKGKKVLDYSVRADQAMAFALPEGVGPGVYRLELVLTDGTELTWPVPFEVTAPYTETFIWQGNHDLAGWGANLEAGPEDGWVTAGLAEGDLVRVYYETYNEWWQFKLQAGHWDAINLETLGGENTVSPNFAESGDTFFSFEVTADILAQLTKTGEGWGYSFVINGEGAYIKGISMIHFGATEKVIYEKTTHMSWDDTGRFGLALQYFEEAGAGSTMIIYFEQTENWGQVQINDGWWGDGMTFPELGGAYLTTNNVGGKDVTKIELTITEEILEHLKSHVGDYFGLNTEYQGDGRVAMVLQGQEWIIEKIALM